MPLSHVEAIEPSFYSRLFPLPAIKQSKQKNRSFGDDFLNHFMVDPNGDFYGALSSDHMTILHQSQLNLSRAESPYTCKRFCA